VAEGGRGWEPSPTTTTTSPLRAKEKRAECVVAASHLRLPEAGRVLCRVCEKSAAAAEVAPRV